MIGVDCEGRNKIVGRVSTINALYAARMTSREICGPRGLGSVLCKMHTSRAAAWAVQVRL